MSLQWLYFMADLKNKYWLHNLFCILKFILRPNSEFCDRIYLLYFSHSNLNFEYSRYDKWLSEKFHIENNATKILWIATKWFNFFSFDSNGHLDTHQTTLTTTIAQFKQVEMKENSVQKLTLNQSLLSKYLYNLVTIDWPSDCMERKCFCFIHVFVFRWLYLFCSRFWTFTVRYFNE